MQPLKNAEWIWINDKDNADEYAEFIFEFESFSCEEYFTLNIASDSNYNLYLNGKLLAFGQYADYPDYKVYDTIDLRPAEIGKNQVKILVWYYGISSSNYLKDTPGVIFDLFKNGKLILSSNTEIKSRLNANYQNYLKQTITSQLGLSFTYDARVENTLPYEDSVVRDKSKNLHKRPNDKLVLEDRVPATVSNFNDSYIIDLGEETVGFIDLDFEAEKETELRIAWGEFLLNGEVHCPKIDKFYLTYRARAGKNLYTNYFRRLGCRYLQVFADNPIKINYIGVRPTTYPITKVEKAYKSPLHQKIYNVAVKTLHCCMHEHYEDCPWREQALYNMDSRNEMLFTYIAFNDYKFARSNLVLMSKSIREEGLLPICFPAGTNLFIPSFSAIYPVQVCEYFERTNDIELVKEVFPTIKTVMTTFINGIDKTLNLLPRLPYPCWNFFEWSYGSSDSEVFDRKIGDPCDKKCDLLMSLFFLYALPYYKKLCNALGEPFTFDEQPLRKAIVNTFYDKENRLFKAVDRGEPFYTVLGNALAILTGFKALVDEEKLLPTAKMAEKQITLFNTKNFMPTPQGLVPISLSMCLYLYDALLTYGTKYKQVILDDIDSKFKKMLDEGATTFWETELGYKDFGTRGSLCHGWSALPIYYYEILNGKDFFNGEL